MTRKAILSFFLLMVFTGLMLADGNNPTKENNQTMKISGKVVDSKTGETLAGVKVMICGSDKVVYTGFDGEFAIECAAGNEIQIEFLSYTGKKMKIDNPENLHISLCRQ
jgi:hypothetical protein